PGGQLTARLTLVRVHGGTTAYEPMSAEEERFPRLAVGQPARLYLNRTGQRASVLAEAHHHGVVAIGWLLPASVSLRVLFPPRRATCRLEICDVEARGEERGEVERRGRAHDRLRRPLPRRIPKGERGRSEMIRRVSSEGPLRGPRGAPPP